MVPRQQPTAGRDGDLPVLCVFPRHRDAELWKKLTTEFGPERRQKGLYKDVWPSNAFIGNLMRLIILKREGLSAQVGKEVRGYYLKMAEQTGTLWENDSPHASCNHGFASYVALLLQAYPGSLTDR